MSELVQPPGTPRTGTPLRLERRGVAPSEVGVVCCGLFELDTEGLDTCVAFVEVQPVKRYNAAAATRGYPFGLRRVTGQVISSSLATAPLPGNVLVLVARGRSGWGRSNEWDNPCRACARHTESQQTGKGLGRGGGVRQAPFPAGLFDPRRVGGFANWSATPLHHERDRGRVCRSVRGSRRVRKRHVRVRA